MSFEKRYEDTESDKTMYEAVIDIKKFLGYKAWDKFLIIITAMVTQDAPAPQIELACSFVGVHGYPVTALVRFIKSVIDGKANKANTTEVPSEAEAL